MRVLIAHTDETSRTKLAEAVHRGRPQQRDVDVVLVSQGSDALDLLLHDDPPEVALVDWDLSGIEGPEMCRLVRDFRHGRATWVCVLAGPGHEDTADAWRAGARDCVAMPASAATVADAVAKGLREVAPDRGAETAPESGPVAPPGATVAPGRAARTPRPALDAVRSDVRDDGFADLTADLTTTLTAELDAERPAELAAGPATLSACRVDVDDGRAARRGRSTLDALLARL